MINNNSRSLFSNLVFADETPTPLDDSPHVGDPEGVFRPHRRGPADTAGAEPQDLLREEPGQSTR